MFVKFRSQWEKKRLHLVMNTNDKVCQKEKFF